MNDALVLKEWRSRVSQYVILVTSRAFTVAHTRELLVRWIGYNEAAVIASSKDLRRKLKGDLEDLKTALELLETVQKACAEAVA